jgi:1,2-dihydroxy-3-keto-5-methylthiopentene dioxygenase
MTQLTRFAIGSADPRIAEDTQDARRIESILGRIDVGFERWQASRNLEPVATQDQVLGAYQSEIDRLIARGGYQSVDVVRMLPGQGDTSAARAKFLSEHTHDDDEVRFFVAGAGAFYLRDADEVLRVICTKGDLLVVPSATRHWFDMGPQPDFCAIRLFTRPGGWVASFTGDVISTRLPGYEP